MKHLSKADYVISSWSGGSTTQLAIGPEGARYADRDFLWRISSATVDMETSEFTALPDYDRLITPLRGTMILTHNGGAPIGLKPLEVHAFSGADATHSEGKCTDFNLMLRRGRCEGRIASLRLKKGETVSRELTGDTVLFYAASGICRVSCGADGTELEKGEAVLIEKQDGNPGFTAAEDTVLMIAEIKYL